MSKDLCLQCGLSKETGECLCDIDFGIEKMPEVQEDKNPLMEDLTPEEQAIAKKMLEKQAQVDPILQGFNYLSEKPTEEQLEAWKKTHGKIYTIGLSDDEFYIFRPLKRLEWRNLMSMLQKQTDELKRKEVICQKAVLWPKLTPDKIGSTFAGTMDTLHDIILQSSNFLMPQEALACVRKL